MDDITRQLGMRRPATVVRSAIVDTRPRLLMTAPYHRKADLSRAVLRQAQRGQVRPLDARPRWNDVSGQWEQRVLQLRPPAPAWIRPTVWAGVALMTAASLFALVWWVLATLAALPLGMLCAAAAAALWVAVRVGRPVSVRVTQSVDVRVR